MDNPKTMELNLDRKREETIKVLNYAFSNNLLDMDEFEHRVELAEYAKDINELGLTTRDLPNDIQDIAVYGNREIELTDSENIECNITTRNLSGTMLLTKKLNVNVNCGTVRIDYRDIVFPNHIIDLYINARMSTIIIYIPDNVIIENRTKALMSNFMEPRINRRKASDKMVVIRIFGEIKMSTVKVKRQVFNIFRRA
jgi:hypothetical protein